MHSNTRTPAKTHLQIETNKQTFHLQHNTHSFCIAHNNSLTIIIAYTTGKHNQKRLRPFCSYFLQTLQGISRTSSNTIHFSYSHQVFIRSLNLTSKHIQKQSYTPTHAHTHMHTLAPAHWDTLVEWVSVNTQLTPLMSPTLSPSPISLHFCRLFCVWIWTH